MATTRISTLRPGGSGTNVYSSLSAWRSSLPSNLVTADTVEILEVEAQSGGWDIGTGINFSGVTTDATRYIEIRAASGHRHSGTWDTTKALFKGTPNNNSGLISQEATHTLRVLGLQFEVIEGPSGSAGVVGYSSSGGRTVVDGCLFNIDSSNASTAGYGVWIGTFGTGIIANCTFIRVRPTSTPGTFDPYRGINHTAGTLVAYNNTFYECGVGIYSANNGSITLRNNLVACSGVNASYANFTLNGASTTNCSYNATTGATVPGSNGRTSQTFTFKGAPNNLKLADTDAGARDFGTDLSADATYPVGNDCGDQARSGTWSIGADHPDPASTIALTAPLTNRIHQHIYNVATVGVTGTYTGTPASIQARVVNNGTSTPVAGLDWFTAVASPSGGSFSFNISNVPKALQWYQVQVRFSDDTVVTASSGKVAVGELVCIMGQSNGAYFFASPSVSSPSTYGAEFGRNITNWVSPAGGYGSGTMVNDLVDFLGCPVGAIATAVDGTSIANWIPGQTYFTEAMGYISSAGGKIGAAVWIQGEINWDSMSGSTYLTHLQNVFDGVSGFRPALSQSTLPVVIVGLGRWNGGSASTYDQIKAVQKSYALSSAYNSWVERADLHPAGELHLSTTNHGHMGKRIARAIAWNKGLVTTYRGPRIRKINRISATVYRVELTHDMGTDITPSTGITGWTCKDPGAGGAAITVSSATRFGATWVELTLSSAPVATHPTFSYLAGVLCDVATPVKDNGSLALPVEYTIDHPSRTLASSLTLTLENGAGAPAASLTGLKWAFFDQPTPDAFLAPVAKGTTESTDGSGVIVVSITGTDLDAGANGYLIVTDSDGTITQDPPAKRFAGTVQVA